MTVGDTTEMVEVSGEAGHYRLTIGSEVWEVDGRLTAQGIYSLLIVGCPTSPTSGTRTARVVDGERSAT